MIRGNFLTDKTMHVVKLVVILISIGAAWANLQGNQKNLDNSLSDIKTLNLNGMKFATEQNSKDIQSLREIVAADHDSIMRIVTLLEKQTK